MKIRSEGVPYEASAPKPDDNSPSRGRKRFEGAAARHWHLQAAWRGEEQNETLKHPALCQAESLPRRLLNFDAPWSSHDQQVRPTHEQTVLDYTGNPVELSLQRGRIFDVALMQIQDIVP